MDAVTERLKNVMEKEGLTAAQMADRIGVQRSAISHILSGRNRPSLDFILKVLESFPEVSSEWLLRGHEMDAGSAGISGPKAFQEQLETQPRNSGGKVIEKVLILYSDKTVEEYRS